jgi:hypothetical protein
MKTFFAFFGIIILCGLMPLGVMGVEGMKYEAYKQLTPTLATGGGDNDVTLTLVNLPSPNTASAIKIVKSTLPDDMPVVTNYNDLTKVLTVGGLEASQSRSISVTYNVTSSLMETYPYLSAVPAIIITFMGLGLLGVIIAVLWAAFSGKLG